MSRWVQLMLLLILANVVIFWWPSQANNAPHVYPQRNELNPHFVRLNKEIEDRFYSKANGDIELEGSSQVSSLGPAAIESVPNVVDASGDGVCYRLGPFMHQASYDLAQAVLFNADVNFQKTKRASQESDVYRLFLGPFGSGAEVADARLDLKRKRILDHFSRKLDSGEYMISLGIYSTRETASTALRLFDGKLDGVQMQNETVVLPDSYWLHFVLQQDSEKFEQMNDIEWGENSVKLGPHTCRT